MTDLDRYLEGVSLQDLLDEDIPNPYQLAQEVRQALTEKHIEAKVHPTKDLKHLDITLAEHSYLTDAILSIYETAYPEITFIVRTRRTKAVP